MDASGLLDLSQKFDAVVVDEGQDFQSLWWTSLEGIFKNPSNKECYYIFYDPNQNIYLDASQIPQDFGSQFKLQVNCRNTQEIANHCGQLIAQEIKVKPESPLGMKPELIQVSDFEDAIAQIKAKVRKLYIQERLEARQIAILCNPEFKDELPNLIGNVELTVNHEQWRNNKAILKESWKRFKGLEADAVIMLDYTNSDDPQKLRGNYVAYSRARHVLILIEILRDTTIG